MHKQPCSNCPFRLDVGFPILISRKVEILQALWHDGDFPCHKTTGFNNDGKFVDRGSSKRCIGAAIMLERFREDGGLRANLMFRLALWSKEFTIEELDLNFPICSPNQFLSNYFIDK